MPQPLLERYAKGAVSLVMALISLGVWSQTGVLLPALLSGTASFVSIYYFEPVLRRVLRK